MNHWSRKDHCRIFGKVRTNCNIYVHQSNIDVHQSNINVHQWSINVSAHIFEELGFVFDVSQEPVQHSHFELVIGHPAHVLPRQWHQMGEPVENETWKHQKTSYRYIYDVIRLPQVKFEMIINRIVYSFGFPLNFINCPLVQNRTF